MRDATNYGIIYTQNAESGANRFWPLWHGVIAVIRTKPWEKGDGLKRFSAATMRAQHPDRMIKEAVWGMLPKNNIARKMMTRLKVFAGAEHTHAAQKPVEIKL